MLSVSGGDGGDNVKQIIIIVVAVGVAILIIIFIIIVLLIYKKRFDSIKFFPSN